jgi:hypothetical protein
MNDGKVNALARLIAFTQIAHPKIDVFLPN